MSQTIRYMSLAKKVQAAADNAAATSVPSQGSTPSIMPSHAGDVVALVSTVTLTAALDPMLTNDMYVACVLPANMQLLDAAIICDDIDTATALTLTLGGLHKDFTDITSGSDIITASTIGRTGGVARADVAAGLLVAPVTTDTWIGVKVAAAPTGLNADAKLCVRIWYQSPCA
jgi:hypothetical protein